MFYDMIHKILPMNETQRLIMEGVLHHIIITTILNYVWKELQLLLYIRKEGRVSKSWVIKGIELGFLLFSYRANLVFAISTRVATSNIEGSRIHTCLEIGIRYSQKRSNKVSSM